MLRFLVLFTLVAAAANANATFKLKCPVLLGKHPVDLGKFQGDWYLAAANDPVIEKKGKCGKINIPTYVKKDNETTILSSSYTGLSIKDNSPIALEVIFQPMLGDQIGILYGVSRLKGSSTYSPILEHAILASDYSSYALVLGCKPTFDAEAKAFGRTLYTEIWTRQGIILSKDTMDILANVLASYDIEPASIKVVENNCQTPFEQTEEKISENKLLGPHSKLEL